MATEYVTLPNSLTGASLVLPAADASLYQQQLAEANAHHRPATHREKILVQMSVDAEWRLQRIPSLVAATEALARVTHADLFADQPEVLRPVLLAAHIQQVYRRQFNSFLSQERQLRKQRERDLAELKQIQQERRESEQAKLESAAALYLAHRQKQQTFDPKANGFEFSIAQIEQFLAVATAPETPRSASASR